MAHAAGDSLHAVGDHLTRNQGILHALGAHGDAVGNRQYVIDDALAAGLIRTLVYIFRELVDVHIAGGHHAPGGGNTDLGLPEISILEAHRAQHGTARSLLNAINHYLRMFTQVLVVHDISIFFNVML